jgi:hypothetical protein
MMSNFPAGFDPMGTVIDWIDACRARELATLVQLYDDAAVIDCCEGGKFRGHSEVERYWRPKLSSPAPTAFEIDVLMPHAQGVLLDYRAYDGKPVRTIFQFNDWGKIVRTTCRPIDGEADATPRAA